MSKKKIVTIILAIILLAIAGASIYVIMNGGKETGGTNSETTTKTNATTQQNLSNLITETTGLSKFNRLLTSSEVIDTLKDTNKKYIVMAPRNGAFSSLPSGYYDSLLTSDKLTAAQSIAKYHIAVAPIEALTNGQKLKTLEGQEVIVGVSATQTTFTSAKGDKAVATSNQKTSNGTLYIIDAVLLPQ